jgi:CheY-like chemotaxis protein
MSSTTPARHDSGQPIRPKVLIADDNYFFSNLLGRALNGSGFEVDKAFTAAELRVKWVHADAIVLDIRLPLAEGEQIDPFGGLQTLQAIQDGLPRQTPRPNQIDNCIIRSANNETDARAANAPVPRHFRWYPPDVPLSELIESVREVIRRRDSLAATSTREVYNLSRQ